jgi:fumarate hydratase class II
MTNMREESDSLGVVELPADKLWGAQTQRSLQHFSIGKLIPREMITAYAILKKAAATANHTSKRLDDQRYKLIVQACDEILAGQHHDMFPLHVWMTGSGTQFNMNLNEVISNRCCQLAGTPLGSHAPVHPNDHVNMAQSSNDSFPSAMYIAAAVNVKQRLVPAFSRLNSSVHTTTYGDLDHYAAPAISPPLASRYRRRGTLPAQIPIAELAARPTEAYFPRFRAFAFRTPAGGACG